jgi:hypothetical protein
MLRTGIYCQPSTSGPPGTFDTPVHAQRMLQELLAAHSSVLSTMPVADPALIEQYSAHASGPDGKLMIADIAKPGLPAGTDPEEDAFQVRTCIHIYLVLVYANIIH